MRSSAQGVKNIIRFNWPYYALVLALAAGLLIASRYLASPWSECCIVASILTLIPTLISLVVSFWIYDRSGLYDLVWLQGIDVQGAKDIVTLNAGLDEVSDSLARAFPNSQLRCFDFFDPTKNNEPSIERAKASGVGIDRSIAVQTQLLPNEDQDCDLAFLFMSAHEIRDRSERIVFFKEIKRALRPHGKIVVVEHLRDPANFMAYTIGAFHFLSAHEWLATFDGASLRVAGHEKHTPFVSVYVLEKD